MGAADRVGCGMRSCGHFSYIWRAAMSLIQVSNLTFAYDGSYENIFENVSFQIDTNWRLGFTGRNGRGKTTFLNLLLGKYDYQGRISTSVEFSYFPYFVADKSVLALDAVEAMYPDYEYWKIQREMAKLQLDDEVLYRSYGTLSNGEQTKLQLAVLFSKENNFLLIDEPTNHLDIRGRELVSQYLSTKKGFILVSHDMDFLNSVVNVIYNLDGGNLTRYTGDYNNFLRMYEIQKAQEQRAYERQQAEIEKLEDFIARNKARVATRGMANSRQKQLDKMEILDRPTEKIKPEFSFLMARTPSRFIVEAKDLVLGYEKENPLTKPVSFTLERGQKVAIVGTNGLGKTTLLKTILGKLPPVSGEVHLGDYLFPGYFEQEAGRDSDVTALDTFWAEFPSMENREVRLCLVKCGLTNEHITSQMRVLSGGENAKVRLAIVMNREHNWLVLDEPTNHLDVDAKDELKRALIEYPGTILLVSHDPSFYEDFVTDIWNVEDWTTKIV